jgi:hypothetical protein
VAPAASGRAMTRVSSDRQLRRASAGCALAALVTAYTVGQPLPQNTLPCMEKQNSHIRSAPFREETQSASFASSDCLFGRERRHMPSGGIR